MWLDSYGHAAAAQLDADRRAAPDLTAAPDGSACRSLVLALLLSAAFCGLMILACVLSGGV